MNDLISRQAAIKAFETAAKVGASIEDIKLILAEMLSAQTDIIYCKDCKHHWTYKCMDSMPIEICDLNQTFYDANIDYCSLAERRENDRLD